MTGIKLTDAQRYALTGARTGQHYNPVQRERGALDTGDLVLDTTGRRANGPRPQTLRKLVALGLVERTGPYYRLTALGIETGNAIVAANPRMDMPGVRTLFQQALAVEQRWAEQQAEREAERAAEVVRAQEVAKLIPEGFAPAYAHHYDSVTRTRTPVSLREHLAIGHENGTRPISTVKLTVDQLAELLEGRS